MSNDSPTFSEDLAGVMIVCTSCQQEAVTGIDRDGQQWRAQITCTKCGRHAMALGPAPVLAAMSAVAYWVLLQKLVS